MRIKLCHVTQNHSPQPTMVRSRNQKAIRSEARVKEALNQAKGKKRITGYRAAKNTGASMATVYRRLKGGKSRAEAREAQQLLHNFEEKALTTWITMMAATGNPVSQACVKEMAEDIRKQRLMGVNDESLTLIEYSPIGQSWVQQFLNRYSSLKTTLSRSIEVARLKEVTPELVSQFFYVFTQVVKDLNIQPQDVYNMDETGNFCYYLTNMNKVFHWEQPEGLTLL